MNETTTNEMPTFEVVYAYAEKTTDYFIQKIAKWLPREHKEEIKQDAFLRAAEAYKKFDPDKGWRSFIQLHCRGAVLDYLKLGSGNIEDGFVSDEANDGLKHRVNLLSDDGASYLSTDEVLGLNGVFTDSCEHRPSLNIRWDLVSRMASFDDDLHIVAKVLVGFTQDEIADQYRLAPHAHISRERVSQRFYEFFDRLDNGYGRFDAWLNQCIYALGLSEYYHEADKDHGVGWSLRSINLRDPMSFRKAKTQSQLSLFDSLGDEKEFELHRFVI